MNELLETILEAYGGLDRWRDLRQVSCSILVGGRLWGIKGVDMGPTPVRVTCQLHEQKTQVEPFGSPGWVMTMTPARVAIQHKSGGMIAERDDPKAAFAEHERDTPWDPLHLAFFNGYATWTSLAWPWIFSEPDVETWEIDPMIENGEVWRSLRVRLPDRFVSHHDEQTLRIGPDGLIRRHDYEVDIWDGSPVAHYLFEHVEVQGLTFPTRHRAYLRDADNTVPKDLVTVSTDMSDWALR
jgi:hypothetical protein